MAGFKCKLSLIVVSVALVHCSRSERSEPRAEASGAAQQPSPAASERMRPASRTMTAEETERARQGAGDALTDAQIMKLMDLANAAEVEEGKLAEGEAKNRKVKQFAAKMVTHHGQAMEKGTKLATQLAVTPAESALSAKMKNDSEGSLAQLKSTPAKDFDRAYIDAQVDEHKKVLSTIDDKLIPAARDPQLMALLREMRTTVHAHLVEAQQIQASMPRNAETR